MSNLAWCRLDLFPNSLFHANRIWNQNRTLLPLAFARELRFAVSKQDPQNAAYRHQFHCCAFDLTMNRTGFTERGEEVEDEITTSPIAHGVASDLVDEIVYDALVWSSLHGLVVGDRRVEGSGTIPGVALVHAPFSLLPMSFPKRYWRQASELAPIFNELVDRVSLDGKFLQDALSRTKQADAFTSRLLDIHSEMLEINKKEDIRLGLHRSDYMVDGETNLLLQIEFNTISSSFAGLSCLVSELHRNLLNHYGKNLGLDPRKVPGNTAASKFAEAIAKAWNEYNNTSAVVMVVVQGEERNMYDQHWLTALLKEIYPLP